MAASRDLQEHRGRWDVGHIERLDQESLASRARPQQSLKRQIVQLSVRRDDEGSCVIEDTGLLQWGDQISIEPPQGRPPQIVVGARCPSYGPTEELDQLSQSSTVQRELDRRHFSPPQDKGRSPVVVDQIFDKDCIGG